MQWISVKDKLPELNQHVLIAVKFNRSICIDYISFPKDGNLWTLTDKEWITHWLPLPELPKE
jgi:hypothetical protein